MQYNVNEFLDLISKKLAGTISDQEEFQFRQIITEFPEAMDLFAEELALYNDPIYQKHAAERDIQRDFLEVIEGAKKLDNQRKIRVLAACMVAVIITGLSYFQLGVRYSDKNNEALPAVATITAPPDGNTMVLPKGKEDSMGLPDGSAVIVNADSRLQILFSSKGEKREVKFSGEGYFKIAPGSIPFIIHTPHATIEVLGTEFNLNTYDSGFTRISLINGKIRFKALNKSVIVNGGHELLYSHGSSIYVNQCFCSGSASWRKGIYPFNNLKLKSVLAKLERIYNTPIMIDEGEVVNRRITGVIDKTKGLERNISNLQSIVSFHYYFSDDTLHIAP